MATSRSDIFRATAGQLRYFLTSILPCAESGSRQAPMLRQAIKFELGIKQFAKAG
jgi:hypothetical protein